MSRQSAPSSNTDLAVVLVPFLITLLAALSYAVIHYFPAQNFGELAWKLVLTGVIGIIFAFFGSVLFTSGGSGSLGAAVFCLVAELIVIAIVLGLAGYWPHSTAVLHERAQWVLMGLQSCFLLFVAWA